MRSYDQPTRHGRMPDVLFTPKQLVLTDDETTTIRLLKPTDVLPLINYFGGLSEQTRSYFSPHSFDPVTVHQICNSVEQDDTIRLVAALPNGEIVAYLLLLPGATTSDLTRYGTAGVSVQPDTTYSFAPSIADAYQGRGLGGHLLQAAIDVARQMEKRQLILWGGVQANNERAVHFYQKHGFQKVAEFERNGLNYSMVLSIESR
ncbi:GNAT family N-acetyltransferase [Spirosoma montaniterrae]|nr:GNAT family N-acetyltransferase [Spirosoma montaniterrae]